eukprot:6310945-Amphidinium_carterae.1
MLPRLEGKVCLVGIHAYHALAGGLPLARGDAAHVVQDAREELLQCQGSKLDVSVVGCRQSPE